MELDTKAFVKKFGNDKAGAYFKRHGKINSVHRDSCMRTAEEWYPVEIKKNGKANIYVLGEKYDKRRPRKDNRGKELITEYEISSLLLSYLVQNTKGCFSIGSWVSILGLFENKFVQASYSDNMAEHAKKLLKIFEQEIASYNLLEDDIEIIGEFMDNELRRAKGNLISVFTKLKRLGIVKYKKTWYGKTLNHTDRKLTKAERQSIDNLKEELLKEYGITSKDLWNRGKEEVKKYQKDYNKQLREQFGYRYTFQGHDLNLILSQEELDKIIIDLKLEMEYELSDSVKSFIIEEFKDKFSLNSLKLAEDRQNSRKGGSPRTRTLKIMEHYVPMWNEMLRYFDMLPQSKQSIKYVTNKEWEAQQMVQEEIQHDIWRAEADAEKEGVLLEVIQVPLEAPHILNGETIAEYRDRIHKQEVEKVLINHEWKEVLSPDDRGEIVLEASEKADKIYEADGYEWINHDLVFKGGYKTVTRPYEKEKREDPLAVFKKIKNKAM